jgi:GABA(A) receptor-associated protein
MGFKQDHELDKRTSESDRILSTYPDRIPIIVEKAAGRSSKALPDIDKKKFLCPGDITVGQFQFVIRKRLKLEAEQALFLTVKDAIPPSSALLSQVYQDFKDEDGFLYDFTYNY